MASTAKQSAEADPEDTKKGQQEKWKSFSLTSPDLWIAIAIIVIILVVGWFFGNAIFQFIVEAKDWFREELPFSLVVYYIFFCFCALIFIPYGPFCIAIGFVFGLQWGFAIQMVAIFLSSAVLFAFGRYVLKDKVHEIIAKTDGAQVWKGLMKYMGKDWKEAAKINILLCFMPVPYGSHPYLFSMTTIPFEQFVLFFMLGMVPNTILNLLIGQALAEAAAPEGLNGYHIIGTGVAIVAIVLGVWYASTIAQQVLDEAETADETDQLVPDKNRASQGSGSGSKV